MNAGKAIGVAVLAGGISVGAALIGEHWLTPEPTDQQGTPGGAAQLQTLPDFSLPDPNGRAVASTAWSGKVLVINYWASWCPPCVNELPLFTRTQGALGARGVQFVGIAIDRAADVKAFIARYPVNYPILIGNPEAVELSRRLGNRVQGMPFTVIFDRHGRRVFSHTGEITAARLQTQLDLVLGNRPASAPPTAPGDAS